MLSYAIYYAAFFARGYGYDAPPRRYADSAASDERSMLAPPAAHSGMQHTRVDMIYAVACCRLMAHTPCATAGFSPPVLCTLLRLLRVDIIADAIFGERDAFFDLHILPLPRYICHFAVLSPFTRAARCARRHAADAFVTLLRDYADVIRRMPRCHY